jgi:hypothetical protein
MASKLQFTLFFHDLPVSFVSVFRVWHPQNKEQLRNPTRLLQM